MTTLAYIPSPGFSKFQIGPVTIRMYAVCILIGVCCAVWILTRRWKRAGGTFDQVLDLTLVTVPCGLVGARLYHCLSTPAMYFPPTGNPTSILKVWEGGMAIFGGIIGGIPMVPPQAVPLCIVAGLSGSGFTRCTGHRAFGQLVQSGTVW